MTDLERLAQWHEERANLDWISKRAKDHTVAAATIRTAMAEIERPRTADVILRQHYDVGWHNGLTEGERRATAAIVADLRAMSALYSTGLPSALATRYEAGDHLAAQEQEQA